jgi:hypothetical protein
MSRYEEVVPEEMRELAARPGMGKPNSYVRSYADLPYYPEIVKEWLKEHYDEVLDSIDSTSIEGSRSTHAPDQDTIE